MFEADSRRQPFGARPAQRRCWRVLLQGAYLSVALLSGLSLAGREAEAAEGKPPPGQPATRMANEYIDLFIRQQRLASENKLLAEEIADLQAGGAPEKFAASLLQEIGRLDAPSRGNWERLLEANFKPWATGLIPDADELTERVEKLQSTWQSVRAEVVRGEMLLYEVSAREQVAGQLASLVNADNRWLWLCGVLAAGSLAGVWLHERRHELRRLIWVRQQRAWGLLAAMLLALAVPLGPTLITFLLGNRTYESLIALGTGENGSPTQHFAKQAAELRTAVNQAEAVQRQLASDSQKQMERIEQDLPAVLKGETGLFGEWQAARQRLRSIVVGLRLETELAAQLQADLGRLAEATNAQQQNVARIAGYYRIKNLTGGALGTGLLLFTGAGGWWYRRGVRRRQKRTSNICPRCLAENTLERLPATNASAGSRRLDLAELHCTNVIRDDPPPGEACDFTFLAYYRDRTKLSFPTLGVAESGKTHWLAMVYRELNQGRYPQQVQFEKVKSKGSFDFDQKVEMILHNRMRTSATTANWLPDPLIFSFRDKDPFGKSNVLVNIFDYAGAITAARQLEDFHRQRALDGDGFFFFLDPTAPSEEQANALVNFREDLRLVKNLRPGAQIHTPVALCVTKIDLLVNQPYAEGNDEITEFYAELNRIDSTARPLSLEMIEQRSQLILQLRDTIWPGWQIERQIQDLFGGRFFFFPFTPVGLTELGETDLSRRTIAPYGILEPLLWLLHMNGYPVME